MIEFKLLGPLEIRSGGRVHLMHGYCQKALLTALVTSEERRISRESLAYEMWSASPPDRADNAFQAHISRLRRTLTKLEPHRQTHRLRSGPDGYRLDTAVDEVDARAFQARVTQLTKQADTLAPETLVRGLRAALAIWRGPVLGGLGGGPICQANALGYERARLDALALLYDSELRQGNHAPIVAELSEQVTVPSVRQEKFAEQLVIALYRCGRQTDALNIGRRFLTHSERLNGYERAILTHDSALFGALPRPALRVP